MSMQRDIFICHASEDKSNVVVPLTQVLDQAQITYWLDKAEIKWGDSLTEKVNEGLRISRYVIVILSKAFLLKKWPQKELNSALNIEASSGKVLVLPLIVGNNEERKEILKTFPLLNDKLYFSWDENNKFEIVDALKARLTRNSGTTRIQIEQQEGKHQEEIDIPIPRIKKKFTARDKDIFLREAFNSIRAYFGNALSKLQSSIPEIQTDIVDIHNFKFICRIYMYGETKCSCKIWTGGGISPNSISYSEGNTDIENDGFLNDWLMVETDDYELGLKPSAMWSSGYRDLENGLLNINQATVYLWRRFTEGLNY